MKTASNAQVRRHNERVVRQVLLERREATRQQLAQKTGLSAMTVGTLLAAMQERGEVEEKGSVPSEGGRPSVRYRYVGERHKVAAMRLYRLEGRNQVRLTVYNLFGDPVYRDGEAMEELRPELLDRLLARTFERVPGIAGIALGLPGQVDGGRVVFCDHPVLEGETIPRRWESLYEVPVRPANDIDAAMLGYVQGLAPEKSQGLTAGFYFPQSFLPGMGLVLEGRPWPGHRGFVGEFHFLPPTVGWDSLDYEDRGAVEWAAARVVAEACVYVAPDRVVLYGDFFRFGAAERIRALVEERVRGLYGLELEVRRDLGPDYEVGMQVLALTQLKETLFGKSEEEL